MRKYIILALLIAGLVGFTPMVGATVAPNPDNADGIDLHSGTVVEGLVVGVSDITSGNTIQVGPMGGIYEGAGSVEQVAGGNSGTQVLTGAGVFTGVTFTPNTADAYIEFYDGTSRGTWANCLLDIQGHVADDTKPPWKGAIEITTGIYAYMGSDGVAQVTYRIEDQSE